MGNVSDLDIARRRRVVSRFCTECHTPWALRAVPVSEGLIIQCRACGHVRATVRVPVFELGGRGQTDRSVVNPQSPESPPGTGTAT